MGRFGGSLGGNRLYGLGIEEDFRGEFWVISRYMYLKYKSGWENIKGWWSEKSSGLLVEFRSLIFKGREERKRKWVLVFVV